MAVDIISKRSAVPGRIPTILNVDLGEFAINTFDGKVYFKQKDDKGERILTLASYDDVITIINNASGSNSGSSNIPGPPGPPGPPGESGPPGRPGRDGDSSGGIEIWGDREVPIYKVDEYVDFGDAIWRSLVDQNDVQPGQNIENEDGTTSPAWVKIGFIISVFGRTDKNIIAQESDYQAFYPRLSQQYNDPSWIATLNWIKITNTPTTLAGYGITDAYTKTQVDNGFVNLNGPAQTISSTKTVTGGFNFASGFNFIDPTNNAVIGYFSSNLSSLSTTLTSNGSINFNSSTGVNFYNGSSLINKIFPDGRMSGANAVNNNEFITLLQLNGREPAITPGTMLQYWRGDKTWQTLNTTAVPEGTNLYYTDARVQTYGDAHYSLLGHTHTFASLTSKPTTISGYGITDTTAQLLTGYVVGANAAILPTDSILTAFGKIQGQLNTEPGGTVTSVAMSVPTGLTVTGSPITSSGTLAVSFASGYSIPTTTSQANWNTAYSWGNHAGLYLPLHGTADNSILWNGIANDTSGYGTGIGWLWGYDSPTGKIKPFGAGLIQGFLGLGSFAYRNSINGNEVGTSPATLSTDISVASYLRWNNYGNGHVIFDASKGIAPNGSTIPSNTNSQNTWIPTHGSLMGWNGNQTYGVRVDMARQSDVWANAGSYVNTDVAVNTYMMGLGFDGNWHPIGKGNLANFLGDKEPLGNTIVQRDANGYINANFIRTPESATNIRGDIPQSLYGNDNANGYHYSWNADAIRGFLGMQYGNYIRKNVDSISTAGSADTQIGNVVTFAYNTSGTAWSGALLSVGGFQGGNYDLQLNGAYNVNELSFRNRNGDNNAWWPWKRVLYNNFPDSIILLGGIGSSYTTPTLQLQHATTPPNLAFHFAGVVASQITIEASGRIAIKDNPGTSYEAFAAAKITASGGFKSTSFQGMIGNYDADQTVNKIIWTIGDQWNTIAAMYGLGYSYNSSFRSAIHQVVVTQAGVQGISLGMDGAIECIRYIKSGGQIEAATGTDGGFKNTGYVAGHNNIWRLGNAIEYGIGYYQDGNGGNDSIGMHFSARATPQHRFYYNGNAVHTGSMTAGKAVIGASDEQVRMIGDNPFISWSRNSGVRIGYIQGTGSGNLAIRSETGPLSLGATGGVVVNNTMTINALAYSNTGFEAYRDGATSDPYGIISVTRGTASNFAYFGMTRAGQVGYSMGIDTGNRFIWGSGAGGGVMNTIMALNLAGILSTVSNIIAGGTLTGAGIGVTTTNGAGQGLSLYGSDTGATQPTYGIMFAQTSNFGTYGSVTADWATYFTLDGTANRGWIFRTVSGGGANVASINTGGNMSLAGSLTAAGGGFNSHRHLKQLYQFDEKSVSSLELINRLYIRKFSYLTDITNTSLGLIIDEIPNDLRKILLLNNDSIDLYSLHSISLMAHKETKTEIEKLKERIKQLEEKYGI